MGCPSVIYFKNDNNLFDEDLAWLMDCEFFYRMNEKYGPPKIIKEHLIGVRIWEKTISSQIRDNKEILEKERKYILEKYPNYVLKPEKPNE